MGKAIVTFCGLCTTAEQKEQRQSKLSVSKTLEAFSYQRLALLATLFVNFEIVLDTMDRDVTCMIGV